MNTQEIKSPTNKKETSAEAETALSVGLSSFNFKECMENLEISEDMQQVRLFGSPWIKLRGLSIHPHYHNTDGIHIRLSSIEDLEIWGNFFGLKVIMRTDCTDEGGFKTYALENNKLDYCDDTRKVISTIPRIYAYIHNK